MDNRRRVIIISPRQFGYQTDYFKYCEYLRYRFNVVFFTFDQGEKKIELDGISIKYTRSYGPGKALRQLLFVLKVLAYLLTHRGIVMIAYGRRCDIYKRLLPWRRMIVNFRTVSVAREARDRFTENEYFRKTALPFDRIIMISQGGAEQIGFDSAKLSIVSLGADALSDIDKNFDRIRLLYVGTLDNRDLVKTIEGFRDFLSKYPAADIHYDIVGGGDEFEELKTRMEEFDLQTHITLHGRKPYDELKPFFDRCNIGVSFVPVTEWYAYQPPTKTFEYCLSGLFCIATDTYANRQVITTDNGLLIRDTHEAFSKALEEIHARRCIGDSSLIRCSMAAYRWSEIVEKQLIPALLWKKN